MGWTRTCRTASPWLVWCVAGCAARATGNEGDGTGGTDDPTSPTDPSDSADSTGGGPGGHGIHLTVNKDVDILFVVDNSGSMGEEQRRLVDAVAAFVDVLEDPGVAASYRIGVTTTDNGNPWCGSTGPEAGNLVMSSCLGRMNDFVFTGNPGADASAIACTDVCSEDTIEIVPTTTEFDPQARPRPWIESIEGETNLGGGLDTVDALRCVLPQGIAGCGFESHLESMYKALLRSQNTDEDEYGFLRTTSVLSVVFLSDETDCSYNNDYQSIFLGADEGGNQVFWSDPDASAPSSAVCWNAGVLCEGSGSPYDSCRAANKGVNGDIDVQDDDAVLHPTSRYIDFVQEIENAKQQYSPGQEVLVSVITGVPSDGFITYQNSLDPVDQSDYGIGPGCAYDDGDPATPIQTARPPVREREFAEAFQLGENPNLHSICQDDYTNALSAIADAVRDQIRPACMPACVADTNQVQAGLQPECSLLQEAPDIDSGTVVETDVPPCGGGDQVPDGADVCYVALTNETLSDFCRDYGWNLEFRLVRRPGVPAPGGTAVSAECQLSQNKAIDCPNLP